ncbi:hypothetical protein [Neptunicoccus cionae]|uniref:Lectin-like protein BA14k n=1 Tax=Neptunicoccus cionae TaxID=2035344 RepID=A0A916VQE6_9RHOB|nr:hypothetical protein [Amylibacter cionae]GGA17866.1 hypothetical protein GCM10011498_18110 [Amylibacter cionae]
MFHKMTLTGILALALVAAPITAPAALAKDNVDRLLLGLTALGVISVIANEAKKSDHQPTYVRPAPQPRHHYKPHYHGKKHYQAQRPVKHHFTPPANCLRKKWTQNGWVKFYNQACVNKYRPANHHGHYRR